MAFRIVAKLSSVRTMSAACFATSVPFLPMAIPTSAAFRDGASFTPSPVMATIPSACLKACTIRTLWSEETLANTRIFPIRSASSLSPIRFNSSPVMHWDGESAIPSFSATARAVFLWSPVIITVVTPAWRNSSTASAASGRIGSSRTASPKNVIPRSDMSSPSFMAAPRTRPPDAEYAAICLSYFLLFGSVSGWLPVPSL